MSTTTELDRLYQVAQQAAPWITGAWRFNRVRSKQDAGRGAVVMTDATTPGEKSIFVDAGAIPSTSRSGAGHPRLIGHPNEAKRITVDSKGGGKAIAGNIKRRLLAGYLHLW